MALPACLFTFLPVAIFQLLDAIEWYIQFFTDMVFFHKPSQCFHVARVAPFCAGIILNVVIQRQFKLVFQQAIDINDLIITNPLPCKPVHCSKALHSSCKAFAPLFLIGFVQATGILIFKEGKQNVS